MYAFEWSAIFCSINPSIVVFLDSFLYVMRATYIKLMVFVTIQNIYKHALGE